MKRTLCLALACWSLLGAVPAQADEGRPLRVLTYNIHHARGNDGIVDVARIAQVITDSQADLVALQEVDRGVERTDRIDIAAELAKLTGFHAVFEKNIDYQGGEYGNAILSRFPVLRSSNRHYKMLRKDEQRGLLQAVVDAGETKLVFASTHLDFRPDNAERLKNADEIAESLKSAGEIPVIVCGDFNDFPGKALHQKMKQSFTDAWEAVGTGDGFTFSSDKPRRRIDYVYFSQPQQLTAVEARIIPTEASDHLPLLVTFEMK